MGMIAVFMIVMLIKTLLKANVLNKTLNSGEVVQGRFIEIGKNMTMGNKKYFSVTYEYEDVDGCVSTVKSPKNYISSDVELLRQAINFDVKKNEKNSVIAFDFDNYQRNKSNMQ